MNKVGSFSQSKVENSRISPKVTPPTFKDSDTVMLVLWDARETIEGTDTM